MYTRLASDAQKRTLPSHPESWNEKVWSTWPPVIFVIVTYFPETFLYLL